ncbi:MAG: class II fructose-bisphosphatase [Deltaproteobacteria bacterium]|nr:class II fructose-bisphosphatase [Deltaproteobacteria bacterium]
MDRNLALELVRVTEAAAISASRLMGRGDEKAADQAAVDAMRSRLNAIEMRGTVVIGEGERDEAPMLYIGEKVGTGNGPELDIALDPLEGTTITARGLPNALAVIAMAEKGNLLNAPDVYMEKIAVGPRAKGKVNILRPPKENLEAVSKALGKPVTDITAIILDRPRHEKLIEQVRATGCRIKLIGDGDVAAAIATAFDDTGVDILFGIGGAPEGVIAAAALNCMDGDMQGRFWWRNDAEKERAKSMGIADPDKVYTLNELAKGQTMFAASGVTDGDLLKGVRYTRHGLVTHSIVMRSATRTIRFVEGHHHLR